MHDREVHARSGRSASVLAVPGVVSGDTAPDDDHPPAPQARAAAPDDALLIINDELPIFPGSGGVEYLPLLHLPRLFGRVALVSLAHRRQDLARAQGLVDAGVDLHLWLSPHLDAPAPLAPAPPTLIRRLHQTFSRAIRAWETWPDRPGEAAAADRSFRNLAPSLAALLRERGWPIVSVVQSHAAHVLDYIPTPYLSVLVMHDVRAIVYARRAQVARSWWERWRCRRQAARYRTFERRYAQQYDVIVTVSDADAAFVRAHYAPRRVITRPLPVDGSYYAPAPQTAEEPATIVFTGLMNHPPNADAAVYMVDEVWPRIRAEVPDAQLWIVGRHPADEVRALARVPGVHVTGEVPDVRPYLARATAVVVPLRYGSGARQKILEAWSMEKCIISSTVGAEGLPAAHDVNLSIADDPATMATQVVRAVRDPAWRRSLSREGRGITLRRHDPERIATTYGQQLRSALDETRRARADGPMRTVLDMRWMIPGLAGGIEQVARAFVGELLALDRFNYYTLILPPQARYVFDVRGHERMRIVCPDSLSAISERWARRVRQRLYAAARLDAWESPEVTSLRWLQSLNAEMVYSFPGYTFPDVQALPQILMVPDIQHEYCPQFFAPEALAERTRVYRASIAAATHLCAISEFTRQTVIDRLGIAPDRITTVHLAADPMFHAAGDPEADRAELRVHGLTPGSYLFFPGHTWLHKNHVAAIRALRILRDRHGLTPTLVCTGGNREAHGPIQAAIAEAGLDGQVQFLGYCTRSALPALYRQAACLVFPSLFEGFGMPVLEAMASGCPVVCSNSTSLPEIAGDAACLVDPEDPEAIALAIAGLLREPDRRAALRARGLVRATAFSWRRHTLDTLALLRRVRARLMGLSDLHV